MHVYIMTQFALSRLYVVCVVQAFWRGRILMGSLGMAFDPSRFTNGFVINLFHPSISLSAGSSIKNRPADRQTIAFDLNQKN